MPLYAIILVNLGVSGLTMLALHLAFVSGLADSRKIRPASRRRLERGALIRSFIVNSVVSTGLVFVIALGFAPYLFYTAFPGVLQVVLESLGVLLVYDFLYYLLHRFPFHEWGYLKRVHSVHHQARHPIAVDSLYVHPLETALGIVLLMFCVAVFTPISIYSFGVMFFVYTQLNITVHCGLDLPVLGHMSRKHDAHHLDMRGGNFASITPLPDLLFRTIR